MKNTYFNLFRRAFALVAFTFLITSQGKAQGLFTFSLTSDSTVTGIPGATLNCYGLIENNSADTVSLWIIREENNIPTGWASAICTDVCLPPYIDSSLLYLYPMTSQSYTQYFYCGLGQNDTGHVVMKFINTGDSANVQTQRFYAYADSTFLSIPENGRELSPSHLFPNPAKRGTAVYHDNQQGIIDNIELFHIQGSVQKLEFSFNTIYLPGNLSSGLYFYRIHYSDKSAALGRLSIIQ
ncbi:MAG TPA: T9SS type A sorting domain-containing protein [Flavobacteriales bacterium]|nr:T9SS type A sorting domain-containing protein [Flavobacteriales bacterium]HIA12786.1 T9SS type A sorting domain-containing protein [Flavobacteriales bacterium]HIO72397.1 T9SS type A sorting domain-containing protein [Flavobacteriales bacterium]